MHKTRGIKRHQLQLPKQIYKRSKCLNIVDNFVRIQSYRLWIIFLQSLSMQNPYFVFRFYFGYNFFISVNRFSFFFFFFSFTAQFRTKSVGYSTK